MSPSAHEDFGYAGPSDAGTFQNKTRTSLLRCDARLRGECMMSIMRPDPRRRRRRGSTCPIRVSRIVVEVGVEVHQPLRQPVRTSNPSNIAASYHPTDVATIQSKRVHSVASCVVSFFKSYGLLLVFFSVEIRPAGEVAELDLSLNCPKHLRESPRSLTAEYMQSPSRERCLDAVQNTTITSKSWRLL